MGIYRVMELRPHLLQHLHIQACILNSSFSPSVYVTPSSYWTLCSTGLDWSIPSVTFFFFWILKKPNVDLQMDVYYLGPGMRSDRKVVILLFVYVTINIIPALLTSRWWFVEASHWSVCSIRTLIDTSNDFVTAFVNVSSILCASHVLDPDQTRLASKCRAADCPSACIAEAATGYGCFPIGEGVVTNKVVVHVSACWIPDVQRTEGLGVVSTNPNCNLSSYEQTELGTALLTHHSISFVLHSLLCTTLKPIEIIKNVPRNSFLHTLN
jgi:hypothetical protein